MGPARPLAGSCAALALFGAGCGTAGPERDVSATSERFQAALEARDGAAACAELSSAAASSLERRERRPCERAILSLGLPAGVAVASDGVFLSSAVVRRAGGGSVFLDRGPRGWKISAAGCTPTGPDLPYDCELED